VEDLLTTKQLQELLQVDRITIYRMLNDGRLRGFKVGGQWRFSRQEIETWLQAQRVDLHLAEEVRVVGGTGVLSPSVLSISCVQAIQDECLVNSLLTYRPDRAAAVIQWWDREWFLAWIEENRPPAGVNLEPMPPEAA
jgi:excisionase family DNA binding protein